MEKAIATVLNFSPTEVSRIQVCDEIHYNSQSIWRRVLCLLPLFRVVYRKNESSKAGFGNCFKKCFYYLNEYYTVRTVSKSLEWLVKLEQSTPIPISTLFQNIGWKRRKLWKQKTKSSRTKTFWGSKWLKMTQQKTVVNDPRFQKVHNDPVSSFAIVF